MKPIIGITAALIKDTQPYADIERWGINADYTNAVERAGGLPLILPPSLGSINQILSLVDGLVFSGGPDIDPALYGDDTVHPTTYGIDERRDSFEIELLREAVERDVPMLAICRGVQVMNVALGGTLIQHIPDHIDSKFSHRQDEAGYRAPDKTHNMAVAPGSLLESIYGSTLVDVNSFHHQAILEVAPGLSTTGISEDGLVEAVEAPDKTFAVGVQWHPEMMHAVHSEHHNPFLQLVRESHAKRLNAGRS